MKTEKSWFALAVTVDAAASEAVEFGLNELDALGTEINNLGLQPSPTLTVNGYFDKTTDDETVRAELVEALRIYGFAPGAIRQTSWRKIGDTDWLFEWKKFWKPTETDKFIVAPTWENVENSDKIVIRIEPSMAFGTGTHETTRLCLKAIEENYRDGMSFFDVGTGTGILIIAAAKLQQNSNSESPKFTGCDTDFDSITIAKENAVMNEVGDRIEFRVGSISADDSAYDFVCANVTLDVIVPMLPQLLEKSKRILILSGILKEQRDSIVAELKKLGFPDAKIDVLGEWISVVLNKRA